MARGIDDGAAYITSPPLRPVLPRILKLPDGRSMPMKAALPIARAVLLAGVHELKQIPGGAKATGYALERAAFHLQRVAVAPAEYVPASDVPTSPE